MSTSQTKPTIIRRLRHALSTFSNRMERLRAPAASGGSSDLLQLYLLSRGSDSVRPAVIRKLRADARG